jgi:hypothetical protein
MSALKLLGRLLFYYLAVSAAVFLAVSLFPGLKDHLPIGRTQALIAEAGTGLAKANAIAPVEHLKSLGGGMIWLTTAILGALVISLPISWVYMDVRHPDDYDQSLVDTIIMLPMVVTGIVVIIQDSLALSFSLAGIAGAARFRNNMKSSGDLLFILLAVGVGLSSGIGAMEIAAVMSVAFNLCFLALWSTRYGERKGMKRYLGGLEPEPPKKHKKESASVKVTTITTSQVVETEEQRKDGPSQEGVNG